MESGVLLDHSTVMGMCAAINTNKNMMLAGVPGTAKCFAKDTLILLYDGSIKKVQDVVIGDLLMGDDSTPRRVISLNSGREFMYKIVPIKGDPYVVNEHHILSLKMSQDAQYFKKGEKIDIGIKEYLMMSNKFKHYAKGYRVSVNFPMQSIKIDPYFLGVWLGDGTSRDLSVTTQDKEIIDEVEHQAIVWGLKSNKIHTLDRCPRYDLTKKEGKSGGNGKNPLLDIFREYNLIKNKHIPNEYKVNSKEVRLKLLAGLIDTDGSLSCGGYSITTKLDILKEDILFLARSLGFAAYCSIINIKGKPYQRIFISGDISKIPVHISRKKTNKRLQKKDVLVTGISLERLKKGEYFGFVIDGNRRFLLADFTVVHNTMTAKAVASALFGGNQLNNYNNKYNRITATPGITRQEFFGDWNYHKQFLEIQAGSSNKDVCNTKGIVKNAYREENFDSGPALDAIKNEGILFVDEGNRGGEDFQNMMLEVAEEKQVTVPMLGTVRSTTKGLPLTLVTYNEHDIGTEPFSDAFKRRFMRIKFKTLPGTDIDKVLTWKHGKSFIPDSDKYLAKVKD